MSQGEDEVGAASSASSVEVVTLSLAEGHQRPSDEEKNQNHDVSVEFSPPPGTQMQPDSDALGVPKTQAKAAGGEVEVQDLHELQASVLPTCSDSLTLAPSHPVAEGGDRSGLQKHLSLDSASCAAAEALGDSPGALHTQGLAKSSLDMDCLNSCPDDGICGGGLSVTALSKLDSIELVDDHQSPLHRHGEAVMSSSRMAFSSPTQGAYSPAPLTASSFGSPVCMPSSAMHDIQDSCQFAVPPLPGSSAHVPYDEREVDAEGSSRARDLLSRDLLEELSHEPDDWNMGPQILPMAGSAPTMPFAGFEIPSEPGSPVREAFHSNELIGYPQQHQPQKQHHRVHDVHTGHYTAEGMMCIDQWDWKTDAPEFVPGNITEMPAVAATTSATQAVGRIGTLPGAGRQWPETGRNMSMGNHHAGMMIENHPGGDVPFGHHTGREVGPSSMSFPGAAGLHQSNRGGHAGGLPAGARVVGPPAYGSDAWASKAPGIAGPREHSSVKGGQSGDSMSELQARNKALETELAHFRANRDVERRNLERQISQYQDVLKRYSIPLSEVKQLDAHLGGVGPTPYPIADGQGESMSSRGAFGLQPSGSSRMTDDRRGGSVTGASLGSNQGSNLDAKMRQLNSLLHETSPTPGALPLSMQQQGGPGKAPLVPSHGQHSASSSTGQAMHGCIPLGTDSNCQSAFSHSLETKRKGAPWQGLKIPEGNGDCTDQRNSNSTGGSITSTLQTMFPHATIRSIGAAAKEEGDDAEDAEDVHRLVSDLELSTGGYVDERAMSALQALSPIEVKKGLMNVKEVVHSQGGQCRNLSSILMSVCRKIEKGHDKSSKENSDLQKMGRGGSARGGQSDRGAGMADHQQRLIARGGPSERRNGQQTDSAFDEGGWETFEADTFARDAHQWHSYKAEVSSERGNKQRSETWADIRSRDEGHDPEYHHRSGERGEEYNRRRSVEAGEPQEHWTVGRVERAAKRGFELRRRDRSDQWDLCISMGGMEPSFSDMGMTRYCQWLRSRLQQFRQEHGNEPLRHCQGEIDFSHNNLTNEMLWMLLEILAEHEVHTSLLKLFANHISQAGVLALCEFIRMNRSADAVQEIHISHNEIDDDGALELLRTFHAQRPRYPPKRSNVGEHRASVVAPVWLRLNHNQVRDPASVLRLAEGEGVAICTAWDRHKCGPLKCCQRDCPLVHLYSFSVQDTSGKRGLGGGRQGWEMGDSQSNDVAVNSWDGEGRPATDNRRRKRGGREPQVTLQ